jgi:predicted phosphate transport protein (TIGR00153 family)
MLLKKHKDPFFKMLEEQTAKAEEACRVLCEYCKDPQRETSDQLKDIEHEADDVRRHLAKKLFKTFITPIDREDLFRLSGDIDNITDYAWFTAKEMHIYGVTPDEACSDMAAKLLDIAREMHLCVSTVETNFQESNSAAVRVKKMRHELNRTFHKAVAALFEQDDIKAILKYRQIYGHLNRASERADHFADVLLTILVKK